MNYFSKLQSEQKKFLSEGTVILESIKSRRALKYWFSKNNVMNTVILKAYKLFVSVNEAKLFTSTTYDKSPRPSPSRNIRLYSPPLDE